MAIFQQSHQVGPEWIAFDVAFAEELRVPMLHLFGWVGIAVIFVVSVVNAALCLSHPALGFDCPRGFRAEVR